MYAVVRKLNSYNIQILCVDGEYRFACNVDDPAFDIKRFESRDEAAEAAKDSEYAHVETFYDAIYNARVAEEKGWRRHVRENRDSLKNSEKMKLDTPRIMTVNKENITECVENEYIFKKIMITHIIINDEYRHIGCIFEVLEGIEGEPYRPFFSYFGDSYASLFHVHNVYEDVTND